MTNHIQESLERFKEFANNEIVGFISDGEDEVNQYLDELDIKGIEAFLQSELQLLEQKVREEDLKTLERVVENMRSTIHTPVGGYSNIEWLEKTSVLSRIKDALTTQKES